MSHPFEDGASSNISGARTLMPIMARGAESLISRNTPHAATAEHLTQGLEGGAAMCMNLLGMLAEAKLPFSIADQALIDRLRVLDAVGYVKASIPAVHVDCDDCARQDPAIVIEVTPRGRKMLSQHTRRDLDCDADPAHGTERPPP